MILNSDNFKRLATNEDKYHIHKTLGIICFINYIYRYFLLFTSGSMFLNTNNAMILIGIHGLLSLSSLIFHIPAIRNRMSPMIYPEFRLHSIIFAMRSVLCCFTDYYILTYKLPIKIALCFLTNILADIITNNYKDTTKTMRQMPFSEEISPEKQRVITLMHSYMQVGATLFMLVNTETAYSSMFAIQLAAFLMTLVRKNIITSNSWHLLYAMALWINIFCYYNVRPSTAALLVILYDCFKLLRFKLNYNKYISWSIIFGCYSLFQYGDTNIIIDNFILSFVSKPVFTNLIIMLYLLYQFKRAGILFFVKHSF
jgi:hypothetical protein